MRPTDLIKLAALAEPEQGLSDAQQLGGGIVGGTAGYFGTDATRRGFGKAYHSWRRSAPQLRWAPHDNSEAEALVREIAKRDVPIAWGRSPRASYSKMVDRINVPMQIPPAVLAHEAGHARFHDLLRNVPGHQVFNRAHYGYKRRGRYPTILAPAAAAMTEDPSYAPLALQTGIMAPTLIHEGMASALGTKALIKRMGWGPGLRAALPMSLAFGTYAAPLVPTAAITAYRKMRDEPDVEVA